MTDAPTLTAEAALIRVEQFMGIAARDGSLPVATGALFNQLLCDFAITVALARSALNAPGREGADQEPKYAFSDGRVFNRASGEAIPLDEPVMIFRGRDKHVVALIEEYLSVVRDPEHREAVSQRLAQFVDFANEHPERMKEPDTDLSTVLTPNREPS